jgi:hypothetical protein
MATFLPDPFAQAKLQVANKSWTEQIGHSSLLHSARSAVSSKGSFASKGIGVAMGVGKLFLALIPIPIVGAVVGATVDAVTGKVRGKLHSDHLKNANAEDTAKFQIKELTVENLDRYRWKVAHSYEALNGAITAYNKSAQKCDAVYAYALMYQQVERRKTKLRDELGKFKTALDSVEAWIAELEDKQGKAATTLTEAVKKKASDEIEEYKKLDMAIPGHPEKINLALAEHAGCTQWCCIKRTAKYDPATKWETAKRWAGEASNFLKPIAVASVAVRQSDYTANSDNTKLRG